MGRRNLGFSQELVGRFFRCGVTRERIRQIESSMSLTPSTIRDYRKALGEATKQRETAQTILGLRLRKGRKTSLCSLRISKLAERLER
jgi:predicted transcriptional regulator